MRILTIILAALLLTACTGQQTLPDVQENVSPAPVVTAPVASDAVDDPQEEPVGCVLSNPEGRAIAERFMPPQGFERTAAEENAFADYLRNLPLQPEGSRVIYYDGREKPGDVYDAVIDMDVGDRDLQQCADAVMRLRAEYLYHQARYDDIHFNFTNGFNAEYGKWMQGYRIKVKGNSVSWEKNGTGSSEYADFRKYLDMVFAYAGSLSLSKEMESVAVEDMVIGDVFIYGGSPGHCVIVVDMAVNNITGEKLFMLAQSYMPAQSIHILKNEQDEGISPWYSVDFGEELNTPEWTFKRGDLKRFGEE